MRFRFVLFNVCKFYRSTQDTGLINDMHGKMPGVKYGFLQLI